MKVKAVIHVSQYIKVEINVPRNLTPEQIEEAILDYYCDELPDPDYTDLDIYDIETDQGVTQ